MSCWRRGARASGVVAKRWITYRALSAASARVAAGAAKRRSSSLPRTSRPPLGNEGTLGISYLLGDTLATEETMIQLPGEASRLRIGILRIEFDRDERLRTVLLRYSQLYMGQIAQGSGCNRVHSLEERCARGLLSTHDRVEGDTFPLTQDFLALMLGVRRSGVSVAQHALQQDGLIAYTRGQVTILDRIGLEELTCSCHGVIRDRVDRFFA